MAYILAADENALVVDLMSIFLSQEGHHFLSAHSLPSLVSILEDDDAVPDVLILSADLEPGFLAELIFELRGVMGKVVPVLVTQPSSVRDLPFEIKGIPALDVLVKPFDSETFMAKVRSLLSPGSAGESEEAPEPEKRDEAFSDSNSGDGYPGMDLGSLATVALNEQIRVWLAEEGRLIMEHEARKALRETQSKLVSDAVWKVVPEMAEEMLRAEIRKLTEELES